MTLHVYLMKAYQDDARRAGEREFELRELDRARQARQRGAVPVPVPAARRLARLVFRRATA